MLFASRYKRSSKLFMITQLALIWLAVAASSVSEYLRYVVPFSQNVTPAAAGPPTVVNGVHIPDLLVEVIFGLSVALTVTISFDSLLQPKRRWRQLRSSAGALQSVIWMYRTRVGPFELQEGGSRSSSFGHVASERALLAALNAIRDQLLSGANLAETELHKRHPAKVYRHYQFRGRPNGTGGSSSSSSSKRRGRGEGGNGNGGSLSIAAVDDFQSPVRPTDYIALRIEPTMKFYKRRIPQYAKRIWRTKLAILLLGVASSVLARYELVTWLVLVTSSASALTSWIEFSDSQRKTVRYTRAVSALEKLLDWWSSLGEVEKASKEVIAHLIQTSEGIISEEQMAWTSAAAAAGGGDRGGGGGGGGGGGSGGGGDSGGDGNGGDDDDHGGGGRGDGESKLSDAGGSSRSIGKSASIRRAGSRVAPSRG